MSHTSLADGALTHTRAHVRPPHSHTSGRARAVMYSPFSPSSVHTHTHTQLHHTQHKNLGILWHHSNDDTHTHNLRVALLSPQHTWACPGRRQGLMPALGRGTQTQHIDTHASTPPGLALRRGCARALACTHARASACFFSWRQQHRSCRKPTKTQLLCWSQTAKPPQVREHSHTQRAQRVWSRIIMTAPPNVFAHAHTHAHAQAT